MMYPCKQCGEKNWELSKATGLIYGTCKNCGNEISFDLFGDFKGNSFVGYEYINDAFRLLIRNF